MIKWTRFPFVRITFLLITGILIGKSSGFNRIVLLLIPAGYITWIIYYSFSRKKIYSRRVWLGFVGMTLILSLGYLRGVLFNEKVNELHLIHHQGPVHFYAGTVLEEPEFTEKYSWCLFRVSQIKVDSVWIPASRKVLIYLPKGNEIEINDGLLIKGTPVPVNPPLNPDEFNYQAYLANSNVYHQHFVRDFIISRKAEAGLTKFIIRIRKKLYGIITENIDNPANRGIVLALVLGIKDELDNEILKAYSASGAMHILAVSGLHVGIIYEVLLALLSGLKKRARGKWVMASVIIVALWFYAVLTGLSPSVLRAVTMFSFIVVGQSMKRKPNIYNSLAASAFVLLLFNPYLIFAVGFQLSYLAVTGIVYLQPKIYRLWLPEAWLPDKIWAITAVSIAAQIATFPLTIYYFNQFPVLFLLSNLFVIPGAFLILTLGLTALATSPFIMVSKWVFILLDHLVSTMNYLIFKIEQIPGSTVYGLWMESYQVVLLYCAILGWLVFFERKQFLPLIISACGLLLLSAEKVYSEINKRNHKELIFYSIPGSTGLDFISGNTIYSYFSEDPNQFSYQRSGLLANRGIINQYILPNRTLNGIRIFKVNEVTIAQIISGRNSGLITLLSPDYILLSNNAVTDLKQLEPLPNSILVIDSSNDYYLSVKLEKQAETLNLSHHSLRTGGALTVKL